MFTTTPMDHPTNDPFATFFPGQRAEEQTSSDPPPPPVIHPDPDS